MSALPPLPALRSFEAVARLGSVTLAAQALHVTHSAVSQQIKLLEAQLGVTLFVRAGRGLRLSEAGRLYALQVRAALQQLGEATRLVQTRGQDETLVVAVMPSFGRNWLLPRLPRFRQRHPRYRVRLEASLEIQDMRQANADVAVRIGRGDWEGLSHSEWLHDELVLVASPAFHGGRLPRTAREAMAGPLIRSAEPWASWCEAAGVAEPPARSGLWINDSNLILEAVRLGQGLALERLSLVADALATGELVQVTPVRVPYFYAYWLVWPAREEARTRQSHFIAWMEEEGRAYAAGLAGLPVPGKRPRR